MAASACRSCPAGWNSPPAWPGWPACRPARAICARSAPQRRPAAPPPGRRSRATRTGRAPGAAAAGVAFLGVAVDPGRNAAVRADGDITAPGAPARAVVVTAREDVEIARQTRATLTRPRP